MVSDRKDDNSFGQRPIDEREWETLTRTRRVLDRNGEPDSGKARTREATSSTAAVKRALNPVSGLVVIDDLGKELKEKGDATL